MGIFDEAFEAFQSMIKTIEVLSVIENQKKVVRIALHEDRIDTVKKFVSNNSLSIALSDFKVKLAFSGDYSSKGIQNKDEGHNFVYVSKDLNECLKAKEFESQNDHLNLGKILGYPDCCIDFFAKNFETESKLHNDFVIPAWKNSIKNTIGDVKESFFPKEINIFVRYFDVALISHCPHSFECAQSLKIAKSRFEMIKKLSPDMNMVNQILELINSYVIYDDGNVHLLINPRISGNAIYYEGVLSTSNNTISKQLNVTKRIENFGKESFVLNGKKYNLPLIQFK